MSHWPTGVTVITSLDRDMPVGCTLNAMMSVSLTPALLAVSLAARSSTLGAVRRTGAFGLNVLAADQHELCQRFSRGRQRDRFHGLSYRWQLRLPMLCDVVAASICTVEDTVPCGDHVLVIGAPIWHIAGERGSPLVFHRRGYHELAGAGEPTAGGADLAADGGSRTEARPVGRPVPRARSERRRTT